MVTNPRGLRYGGRMTTTSRVARAALSLTATSLIAGAAVVTGPASTANAASFGCSAVAAPPNGMYVRCDFTQNAYVGRTAKLVKTITCAYAPNAPTSAWRRTTLPAQYVTITSGMTGAQFGISYCPSGQYRVAMSQSGSGLQ